MRRTSYAWIKSSDNSTHGAFQFQIHLIFADIPLRRDAQRALDGENVMHRRDHELRARDKAVFDAVVVDKRAARRFDEAIALAVTWGISNAGFRTIEGITQNLQGTLDGVDQLDAARQVEEQDGVRRLAKLAMEAL